MTDRPDRFVILHHLSPTGEHWDLMLELERDLMTWQLRSQPTGRGACPIDCVRIQDHRKRYLDYEGPIRGGRGVVTRVDAGRFELLEDKEDTKTIVFAGRVLSGTFCLRRADAGESSAWTFQAM